MTDRAPKPRSVPGCLGRASYTFISAMEQGFYWHGRSVAQRPVLYIVFCLLFTGLCSLGFFNFYMESRPEKLWIPQNSDFVTALEWQKEEFPNTVRIEMVLYEADNVLTPVVVQEMYRIYKEVADIKVEDQFGVSKNQTNLCFRVPVSGKSTNVDLKGEKSGGLAVQTDWSVVLKDQIYCGVLALIPKECLQLGILELWGDNPAVIQALTQQDIINDINTANLSATYLYPLNFTEFLGGIERNSSGHIVSARAAMHQWMMAVNRTAVNLAYFEDMSGLTSAVDPGLYRWEGEFIKVLLNDSLRPDGVAVYASSERSFGEISENTIMGDVTFLIAGNVILYIYVTLMLGRFNLVEQRPLLSLIGLFSTSLAVLISFGLCSACGLDYGPVHSILPLLLLGLGVDDMFVIVQCWTNLPEQDRKGLIVKEQVGRTLQHAGVAITVTSLTDMLAFTIGSTTVLPALRSFCIYSALGVVALYGLQATFFVAWFSFDQTRMQKNRNGLFWCYTHKNHKPNECSQVDYCQTFFDKIFSRMILSKLGKVTVLLVTAALTATAGWGISNLRQEFNPIWFIPQSSYLFSFLSKTEIYFPQAGTRGSVFLGALDYPAELPKIYSLTMDMQKDADISSVDSWYLELANYTRARFKVEIEGKVLNESFFHQIMGKFIFSATGSRFRTYFNFDGNISCGHDAPTILASKFDYQHGVLGERDQQIAAMDRTKALVSSQNFSDFAAPVAVMYSSWETDKVIATELVRNLTLALVAVFVMTVILIANFSTALCVFLCVTLTLVDVMALMTWWGLTVDTVTCINLVLCIGLCVDYSAHIGLHFMQVEGTRDERVHTTLIEMAPPVLNGAVSTFLAFVLLANSDSHVFISFFKIFFGVFVFGVYYGLVFLPVLLSLVGPASYSSHGMPRQPGPHASQPVPQVEPAEEIGSELRAAEQVQNNVGQGDKCEAEPVAYELRRATLDNADIEAHAARELTTPRACSHSKTIHEDSCNYIDCKSFFKETLNLRNETPEVQVVELSKYEVENITGGAPPDSEITDASNAQNNPNVIGSIEQSQRPRSHSGSVELPDENSDEEWKQQLAL